MFSRTAAFQRVENGHGSDIDLVPLTDTRYDACSALHKQVKQMQYGVPASKPLLDWKDTLAASVSILCCATASIVVMDERLAWSLGVKYQLIVVGFPLSIMNLCLDYTVPLFFLCCEARGAATLQNFEAIMRGTLLGDNISYIWRAVSFLLKILPIALSVGYKLFVEGISTHEIGSSSEMDPNFFGLYAPPGLDWTGPILMTNVTLPFIQATATNVSFYSAEGVPKLDPPYPEFPRACGYNMLMLDEHSVAMLDTPRPEWVSRVQAALELGERWNATAAVTATVSVKNDTVDEFRNLDREEDEDHWAGYGATAGQEWPNSTFATANRHNGWSTGLMSNRGGQGDESWTYIGLYPNVRSFQSFVPYAKRYDTIRVPCSGTWTIARGIVELVEGKCDLADGVKSETFERNQRVLRDNNLDMAENYLPNLNHFLGPFTVLRNDSRWIVPTMTAVVASMKWSLITVVNGPSRPGWDTTNWGGIYANTGLKYTARPTIVSSKLTLKRSYVLLLLFAVQPIMTFAMIAGSMMLRSVPVGKGFGIIAVLAGVRPESLGILKGAGFSGEVTEPIQLNIHIVEPESRSAEIVYTLGNQGPGPVEDLRRRWTYS
ncbi:hypothetical protein CBER1_09319 [Cercospora berteroae]|uniref:Uncharacterized protein n=1 Tax=Cercospora berteroae TaxID=357750 RepID=A0A2S6CNH7_9PEZI|nr:hypothetical protein CBER1_09319 [Cercospora berteroae]